MIDNATEAEAAHNALADTDHEYGKLSAYVKMSQHYIKLIKAQQLLQAVGTVAEKESYAYSSQEYQVYIDKLDDAMVELEILEAQRESWQREVDIWRTISANQRR